MKQKYSEQLIQKNLYCKKLNSSSTKYLLDARTKNNEDINYKMRHRDLVTLTALDHYMCKVIDTNQQVEPNSLEESYFKQISIELQKQPLLYFSLPICNLEPQNVSKYIPDFNIIYNKCKQHFGKIKIIKQKFENNTATKDEINYMIKFLNYYVSYNTIDNNEEFFNSVTKYLLEKQRLGLHSSSFVLKYLGYKKCKEEELKDIPILVATFEKEGAIGLSSKSTIAVSKEQIIGLSFSKNTLEEGKRNEYGKLDGFKLLHTIYHELRHALQSRDLYSKKETDMSYSMSARRIIAMIDNAEYNRNYQMYDIESDANRYGYKELCTTMKDLVPENVLGKNVAEQLLYKYALKQDFNYKKDDNNKFVYTGKFTKQMLDKYFKIHPETLNGEFSHFKKFYHSDGMPISLTNLLAETHIGEYNEFLLNQVLAKFCEREKIDKSMVESFDIEQKQNILKNIKLLISGIYSKFSFCKDRLTFNNHFEIKNFSELDEEQTMILNLNMYYNVARSYSKLANYMVKTYPELKSLCSFSIEFINQCINLINVDSEQINNNLHIDSIINTTYIPLVAEGFELENTEKRQK